MKEKWAIAGLSIVLIGLLPLSANAETLLEKVARTGVLTAGTSQDAVPFGYLDADGNWVGYSVDLLKQIAENLEPQLNRPVELKLTTVSTQDWVAKVVNGDVDLVCSTTTLTRSRALHVDFSVGYFTTGTQMLVKPSDSFGSTSFRVGILPDTTNQHLIEERFPIASFVNVENRANGLAQLDQGHIDALVSDGILLDGLRRLTAYPESYQLMPEQPYDTETYACMLPQGNPELMQVVNQTLTAQMTGVVDGSAAAIALFDRWFGESGVVPLDRDQVVAQFQAILNSYTAALGR